MKYQFVWCGLFPLFWFMRARPRPGAHVIYRWAVKVGPIEMRRWATSSPARPQAGRP